MGKNVIISTLPNISQNYLPKVNSSNIFANSLVYDNGTNVLLNTTSTNTNYTGARLVVADTANAYLELRSTGGQSAIALTTATATSGTNPTYEIYNSGDFGIVGYRPGILSSNYIMTYEMSSSLNRRISFQTEGSSKLIINQSGNISIGNTNDTYKLDVSGTARLTGALTGTSATFTSSGNILTLTTSSSSVNGQIKVNNGTSGDIYAGVSASDGSSVFTGTTAYSGYIGTNTNTPFYLVTGGTARVTIASTGAATFSNNVTIGQATAATNVKLILNGVVNKAAGIEFHQSGSPQWYIGNGIASEDNNFELYNSNGTMAMKIIKSTNAINFIGAATFSSSVTATRLDLAGAQADGTILQKWMYDGGAPNTYNLTLSEIVSAGIVKWNFSQVNNSTTYSNVLVLDRGNVGIGTSSPQLNPNGGTYTTIYNASQSGWLELATGSTTDGYGGAVTFNNTNIVGTDKRNAQINGVRDGANNSGAIEFLTWSAGTAGTRMKITSGGAVLINNSSALSGRISAATLQVTNEIYSRGSSSGFFWEDRVNSTYWYGWYATGNTTIYLYNGATPGNIASIAPSNGTYTALSDANKKKDFELSTIGLDAVMNLKPTLYRMKTEDETVEKQLGFIAQEVKDYIPQAYVESGEGDEKFIGLSDRPIIAALTKAIQELKAELDTLKNK